MAYTKYTKQKFEDGKVLTANNLNTIESGLVAIEQELEKKASETHTHTVTYTPSGTVNAPAFTGLEVTSEASSDFVWVAASDHTHSVATEGIVSQPVFTGSEVTSDEASDTATVYSITDVGTLPSHTYEAPSHTYTAPSLTASVSNKCLVFSFNEGAHNFNAGSHGFDAGALPTKGSGVAVPTAEHTHKIIAAGTVSQPTFTGAAVISEAPSITTKVSGESHTHAVTAEGIVSQPTFMGATSVFNTSDVN